jgi:hypothetical protein
VGLGRAAALAAARATHRAVQSFFMVIPFR